MDALFFIGFGLSFVCLLFRTSFHIQESRKGRQEVNKSIRILFSITMFLFWFGWFPMSFWDPLRMDIPDWVTYTGLILFASGFVFVVLSHIKIKAFESKELIKKGIYSKIRHPMYLGFILWFIGFPLFMKALLTLLSSVIWIPQILYWKISEERELMEKYHDYADYKKETCF